MKNFKRRKKARYFGVMLVRIGILLLVLYLLWILAVYIDSQNNENKVVCDSETESKSESNETEGDEVKEFPITEYPEELLELLQKNPETEEFVLNYPVKKNTFSTEELTELDKNEIPLLMQWDSRWGYYQYGDNVMGLTGCGPTCLSMVASYLLQNPKLTPIYMADYAIRNGYCVSGSGTSWDFMSRGAAGLGLRVQEVPLMENKVKQYLQEGNPIICIMGPGEFTDKGHFIVLTGLEDGKIKMNDPNSKEHSKRLWEFEEIKEQIRNIWVYSM